MFSKITINYKTGLGITLARKWTHPKSTDLDLFCLVDRPDQELNPNPDPSFSHKGSCLLLGN